MPHISQSFLKALEGARPGYIWDSKLKGFALRIHAGGEASYYVKFRTPDRKVRWHRIGPVSLLKAEQARKRAEELIAQARLGRDLIGEKRKALAEHKPTINDLWERFQKRCVAPHVALKTEQSYRCSWKNHILPRLGDKKVADLTKEDVLELQDSLSDPEHSNLVIAHLRKPLYDCQEWGWWPKDWLRNPAKIKLRKAHHRDRILSQDELVRLMRVLTDFRPLGGLRRDVADVIVLLLLTALRQKEWLHARWDQIDWGLEVIRVKAKGDKQRVVPLPPKAIAILKERRRDAPWIFPQNDGKGPRYGIDKYWFEALELAGIEEFHCHDLRHTCASYAHKFGGLGAREIQDMLGHANIKTTSIYLNLTDEMRRDGAHRASSAILQLTLG